MKKHCSGADSDAENQENSEILNEAWCLWKEICSLDGVEAVNKGYAEDLCNTIMGYGYKLMGWMSCKEDRNLLWELLRDYKNRKEDFFRFFEGQLDDNGIVDLEKRKVFKEYYYKQAKEKNGVIFPYTTMGKLLKIAFYNFYLDAEIHDVINQKGQRVIDIRFRDKDGKFKKRKQEDIEKNKITDVNHTVIEENAVDQNPFIPGRDDDESAIDLYAKRYVEKFWKSISSNKRNCLAIFIQSRGIIPSNNPALQRITKLSSSTLNHLAKREEIRKKVIAFLANDRDVKMMGKTFLNCSATASDEDVPDDNAAEWFWNIIQKHFSIWLYLYAHYWLNTSELGKRIKKELPNMKVFSKGKETTSVVHQYLKDHPDVYKSFYPYLDFDGNNDILSK